MTRSSRVFVPPADHIFRISWDLSRDTTHSVQENMKTYMSTESPLLPRRPEITNLCQWSIGLARGIMEVLLHMPASATPTMVDTATVQTPRDDR